MQKKLIALAIAGLAAAPAFAQSNVTVYGVMDVSIERVKADGATAGSASDLLSRTRVSSNSSLIGFKGVEDLGNGLKALFQIETSVNGDTGGFGGGRDTFVGLSSGFGTVVLGNLTHPVRTMGAKVDFNPGATGIGFSALYGFFDTPAGAVKTGSDDRANNAVAYVSPSFAGFTVTGAYVAGETRTDTRQPYQWQLAGQYENGPLYAGLAYHRAEDPITGAVFSSGAGLSDSKLNVIRAAAKYTLGTGTSFSGLYDRQELKEGNTTSTKVKRNAWMLGANQNIGAHNVWLQYAKMGDLSGDCGANCNDTNARQWTLGYSYSLSKRTMVHAYYTNLKNDSASNADFYVNGMGGTASAAGLTASALPTGADPKGFGLGLRHTF